MDGKTPEMEIDLLQFLEYHILRVSLAKAELLKQQDRDVRLLVSTCICEIMRITTPVPPYNDDVLRDAFRLIVGTFSSLDEINSHSFGRMIAVLETLAKYRSCVVMLDLECNDLVNEMFNTFLSTASNDHPEAVLISMQTIMILLIDESEDVQEELLLGLLSAHGHTSLLVVMDLSTHLMSLKYYWNCSDQLNLIIFTCGHMTVNIK